MENRTLEEFLTAYSEGKRHFLNWDFDEELSVSGIDLTDVYFEKCFLFLDFRKTKLTNSKFIGCNIKTADFRDSDLTNAIIKNCSVESTMFKGAKTENLIFEENYCYGNTVNKKDFEKIFKESDENYTRIKLTNGFPNAHGIGNILTGEIIEGDINVNDLLILNNGTEIPIVEVEFHKIIPKQRNFAITIPREFDNAETWHKLYGTELKIKKHYLQHRV
ncbi:pentapeptide repeat-containing protein [Winogradskyella schleiferi]|uniref:pentapeptide repeat-containing protein n=1 Tax=Winogradskyella schleiferi TaxID=2686078 RepID=UPI0015B98F74|nr:pentapeptide repeat-containing protein [Winogradskyella schleiferi]